MSKIRGELRQLSPARRLLGLLPVLVVALAVAAALGGVGVASADEPEAAALAADAGSAAEPAAEAEPESEPAADPAATDPAPAQTLTATLPDGTTVKVEAPAGALPQGTTLEAKAVQNDAVTQAVTDAAKADGTELTSVKAYDVTLRNADGDELEPTSAVKVTFSNTGMESSNVSVYHVTAADGNEANASSAEQLTVQSVDTQKAEADEQVFTTDHFSVYAVGTPGYRLKVRFHQWNGTGYSESTVDYVLKAKDDVSKVITDPGAGNLSDIQQFKGWVLDQDGSHAYTTQTEALDLAGVQSAAKTKLDNGGNSDGYEYLDVYAVVFNNYTVTYTNPDGSVVLGKDTVIVNPTDTSDKSPNPYTVNANGYKYEPSGDDADIQQFDGWTTDGDTKVYATTGDSYTVTRDVTFKAHVSTGAWLIFDVNADDATPVSSKFYKNGESASTAPADPERPGNTFKGWYTEKYADDQTADESKKFTFSDQTKLSGTTTLYAKWESAETANYTVIFWQQSVNDAVDAEEKTYDFVESKTYTGNVGDPIDVTDGTYGATEDKYPGFDRGSFDSNKTVANDGSTIVNVYYDRELHKLTFKDKVWHTVSTERDPTSTDGVTRTGSWLNYTYHYEGHELEDRGTVFNYDWGYEEDVVVKTISALYGQDISNNFPIKDSDNSVLSWTAVNENKYFSTENQLTILQVMPDEDVEFSAYRYSGPYSYPFNFYFQSLPDENEDTKYERRDRDVSYTIWTDGDGLSSTEKEDWIDFDGFEHDYSDPKYGTDGSVELTPGEGINFYYKRRSYQISYYDGATYTAPGASDADRIEELSHANQIAETVSVPYEQNTSAYSKAPGTREAPTKPGYVFAGWYDDTTCTQAHNFNVKMPSHNVKVYAKWVKEQYTIVLHPNGKDGSEVTIGEGSYGTDETVAPFTVNSGTKYATPDATRADYEFIGWFTDADCTNPFLSGSPITGDMAGMAKPSATPDNPYVTGTLNLYASWRHTGIVTIEYDANGGSNAPTDDKKYQDQAQAVAGNASTAPEGKHFQYWVVQRYVNGGWQDTVQHVYPGNTFTVDAELAQDTTPQGSKDKTYEMRLRAQYGDPLPMTTVVFMKNGGTDEKVSEKVSEKHYSLNDIIVIPADPQRDGYEFLGWAGSADATTPDIARDATTGQYAKYAADNLKGLAKQSADGTTNTLYACWRPKYASLTIQKEITGDQANLNEKFTFTVTRDGKAIYTKELGDTTVSIGDGDIITIGGKDKAEDVELRRGDKVTITEASKPGYTTKYSVDGGDAQDYDAKGVELTLDADSTKVVFTNNKTSIIPTGIAKAGIPGALTAVGVAALAIVGGMALLQRNALESAATGAHAARGWRRPTRHDGASRRGSHMRGGDDA